MKSNLKQKIENSKVNYSGSILKSLIFPVVALILAVAFAFIFGFNKGMDFNGGIIVSLNAGVEVNLNDDKIYKEYKSEIEEILNENGVKGKIYSVEDYSIVVKIEYDTSNKNTQEVVSNIKNDLVAKYYSSVDESELENRNLVLVSEFGGSVTNKAIITSVLATLVSVLLICVYVGFRNGLHSAIISLLSSVISNIMAWSIIMITRVQINSETLAIIPFVAIASVLVAYLYSKKVKSTCQFNDEYKNKSNVVLCNDVVKQVLFGQLLLAIISTVGLILIGAVNFTNPVLFLSLAMIVGIVSILYTNTFVIPSIYASTFIRKFKKVKEKEVKNSSKLSEAEVMKETDLDNLTSN